MTRTPLYTGVIPPLLTPVTDDGNVDPGELRALIDFQLDAGVDGLFVLGSSGEAAYLDDEARRTVIATASNHIAGQVPLFVGAVETSTNRVIAHARWIAEFEVAALVVTAPFYANVSPGEMVTHFTRVSEASPLHILAYDIPGNVGRKIPRDVTSSLLSTGAIAGLKDSSGSLVDFRRIVDAAPTIGSASLLTGADTTADLALALGADGLVAGLSNVRPDLFVSMYRDFSLGDQAAVARTQRAIIALSELYALGVRHGVGRHASELGAMKTALKHRGILSRASLSAPMTEYPSSALPELLEILKRVDQ